MVDFSIFFKVDSWPYYHGFIIKNGFASENAVKYPLTITDLFLESSSDLGSQQSYLYSSGFVTCTNSLIFHKLQSKSKHCKYLEKMQIATFCVKFSISKNHPQKWQNQVPTISNLGFLNMQSVLLGYLYLREDMLPKLCILLSKTKNENF